MAYKNKYKDEIETLDEFGAFEYKTMPDFAMMPAKEADLSKEVEAPIESELEEISTEEVSEEVPLVENQVREVAAVEELDIWKDLQKESEEKDVLKIEPQAEVVLAQEPEMEVVQQVVATPIQESFHEESAVDPEKPVVMNSIVKIKDIKEKPKGRIYIEEDILVPDVKPDLMAVLSIDGKVKLSEKEIQIGQRTGDTIKVSGDLIVQTLYIPEGAEGKEKIIAIESRVPFKSDYNISAFPGSNILLQPTIDTIEYTIINERKVKVKATLSMNAKEYAEVELNLFEGIKGEDVQMLKEKIKITDVALRKTEDLEIRETLKIKETMPPIGKILKYDVNIVENHKQITNEKAVVNGAIYCNILYLGEIDENHEKEEPTLMQGKVEFTQFIKFPSESTKRGDSTAGGKIDFCLKNFTLTISESEEGGTVANTIQLEADIDTTIEVYKDIEKEIVTDVYHNCKDLRYGTEEIALTSHFGEGTTEVSLREVLAIPEKFVAMEKPSYMSMEVKEVNATIDEGRNIIEGKIKVKLICIGVHDEGAPFSFEELLPFRGTIDIPNITATMLSENKIAIKDIWFDKLSEKQIEVNAAIGIATSICKEEKMQLIKDPYYLQGEAGKQSSPGMILYVTKPGDNMWKIAKKHRTTIEAVKKVNEIESNYISPGTKLLIVRAV